MCAIERKVHDTAIMKNMADVRNTARSTRYSHHENSANVRNTARSTRYSHHENSADVRNAARYTRYGQYGNTANVCNTMFFTCAVVTAADVRDTARGVQGSVLMRPMCGSTLSTYVQFAWCVEMADVRSIALCVRL